MPCWLHVAEKPSVAKEVAAVLSNRSARSITSQSRFNPVFEFVIPTPVPAVPPNTTMLFTSVAGHLMEVEFPAHTKSWGGFPFAELFRTPVTKHIRAELESAGSNIESLAKRANCLVLWLDCDREGENICFEVIHVATKANPRLQILRARFSALTHRDLFGAISNLQPPNKHLSDAVDARSEMDLRIGAVFTRFQTIVFGDRFANVPHMWSFGPCLFPTMGFVVRRHWERSSFRKEEFCSCSLIHERANFTWGRGSIYDLLVGVTLYEMMCEVAAESGGVATVASVEQRPHSRHAPPPLATVTMQKLASMHLRISPEDCMTVAEELYQDGYISYPRTETDSFSAAFSDEDLFALAKIQMPVPGDIGAFASQLASNRDSRFRRPNAGGHDDKAHPPIHPLKPISELSAATGGSAKKRELGPKLLNLIARHFLACVSPDAVAASTSVRVTYGGEEFSTSGQTVVNRGWLEIFTFERWSDSAVPNYAVGQTFVPSEVLLKPGSTEPPAQLSEAALITVMDEHGIGTDATIAQHIKNIVEKEYVSVENGVFTPTALGIALLSAYEAVGLGAVFRPELRAQMELAMADVGRGLVSKDAMLQAAVEMYHGMFAQLVSRQAQFEEELRKHLAPAVGGGVGVDEPAMVLQPRFVVCGRCNQHGSLVLVGGASGQQQQQQKCYFECQPCSLRLRLPFNQHIQLSSHSARCPICSFGVVNVVNPEKQTSHTVCVFCFSSPPPSAMADIEAMTAEFRCFQCAHETCSLAKGRDNIAIAACPACSISSLVLKKTNAGCYMLSCKGYPACNFTVFLPSCESAKPAVSPSGKCARCDALMLELTFSLGQVIPGIDPRETVCVMCDDRISGYLGIRGQGQQAPAPQQAYQMPQVHPRRRGGTRGRGR
jgi:DNA topoisomerase-3